MKTKVRVGVLRGGIGNEYESSMKTGAHVLKHLPSRYEPVDILITKDGVWHVGGVPIILSKVSQVIDVAFNALHGVHAEGGDIQHALATFGIFFTGPTKSIGAITRAKHITKKLLERFHIGTPRGIVVSKKDNLSDITHQAFNTMAPPWVVKPAWEGGSTGVSIARSIRELEGALRHALFFGEQALLEEYVRGKEATIFIVEGESKWYILPPVYFTKPNLSFLDTHAKNEGLYQTADPAHFSVDERWMLENTAREVARALSLRHYAKIDCVVHPSHGVTVLEVNTLPLLHAASPIYAALSLAKVSFSDFLDHVIRRALA